MAGLFSGGGKRKKSSWQTKINKLKRQEAKLKKRSEYLALRKRVKGY